jgi:hypothetical protein
MALYDNCSVLIQLPKDYSKTNELVRFLESKLEGCIFEIRESATEDEPQAAHAFVAEKSPIAGVQTGQVSTDLGRSPPTSFESDASNFPLSEANEVIAEFIGLKQLIEAP